MKASQFFVSTLKEAPADAEVASHKLMTRAGMIKRLGADIYTYMPMGLRVIRKVEAIVREEMDRAGAVELTMPVVQPAELWQESGRFDKMGPELLRIQDRHERDFVVQPTSEEVVTDIARQEIRSYKQLPRNFYQIQTKFRDERRPRFGIMRGREFTMKDAYSFDRDREGAARSYEAMRNAYRAIFDRFGLKYRAVAADSGAIGGDLSEEFQVIADTGEDAIVYCPTSEYAANMEMAEGVALLASRAAPAAALQKVPTPGRSTCADVAALLGVPLERTVKSLVLASDEPESSLHVVRVVRRMYPHLKIVARARNRQHVWRLMDMGIDEPIRETLYSSLKMTKQALIALGMTPESAVDRVERFRRQDAELIKAQYLVYDDETKLVQTTREALADLERLFEADAEPQAREARERDPDTPLTSPD